MTAMTNSDFPVQVMLRERDEPHRACYAEGGLAAAAAQVQDAGRGGDDILIHINHDELKQLIAMWGEPTINPDTGMPEFFLGGLQKWFKDNEWAGYALPLATSVLLPGLGSAVGSTVGGALGMNLSPAMTGALGSGLVGAGLGALTGGGKGALTGALLGGLGGYFTAPGESVLDPITGKTVQGESAGSHLLGNLGLGGGSGGGSSDSSGGGLFGGGTLGKALPLMLMAGALSGMGGSKSSQQGSNTSAVNQQQQQQAIAQQQRPLSKVTMPRTRVAAGDPRTAGYRAEDAYYDDNRLPGAYARGGSVKGALPGPAMGALPGPDPDSFVEGPGDGRADKIPAALSDGEYVMDAETTAMLGNGSSKAGAQALDQMRANIRQHKGRKLARGKISPPAKPAHAYLPKGAL